MLAVTFKKGRLQSLGWNSGVDWLVDWLVDLTCGLTLKLIYAS